MDECQLLTNTSCSGLINLWMSVSSSLTHLIVVSDVLNLCQKKKNNGNDIRLFYMFGCSKRSRYLCPQKVQIFSYKMSGAQEA